MFLLEETHALGKNKSSWSWEAEIILCRRYLVWGLMEFLRLDGNISWIEISFTGEGGVGLYGSHWDRCPRESLGAAPASVLSPGRSWRGPRSLVCGRDPTAIDSGILQFSWPVSAVYLTLSTPPPNSNTSPGACVNVALTFSWFRAEPATGFFVWETQKSHE